MLLISFLLEVRMFPFFVIIKNDEMNVLMQKWFLDFAMGWFPTSENHSEFQWESNPMGLAL